MHNSPDLETSTDRPPLSIADWVGSVALAAVLVEVFQFSWSLLYAWLVSPLPMAANVQARLTAAAHAALDVRARTRLERLLIELVTLPLAAWAVVRRPQAERKTFISDRSAQATAVGATLALTLRALDSTLLVGCSDTAAIELTRRAAGLAAPLLVAQGRAAT